MKIQDIKIEIVATISIEWNYSMACVIWKSYQVIYKDIRELYFW